MESLVAILLVLMIPGLLTLLPSRSKRRYAQPGATDAD